MRRLILGALASAAIAGALSTPASAGGSGVFCAGASLPSGSNCTAGTWRTSINQLWGYNTANGYTGTWVSNNSGVRVSADAYCDSPAGCDVAIFWSSGSTPNGKGTVHNHGGFWSTFEGWVSWLG
jgi:hypothetical protein